MQLNVGQAEEYKRRHDELWPDLEAMLKDHGVHNYSISLLEETNQLFAYAEIESEEKWNSIPETEVCQRWWKFMSDVMPSEENSYAPLSSGLTELFYLK